MYNLNLKQTINLLATDILISVTFDLIVVLSNIKNTNHVKKYSFEIYQILNEYNSYWKKNNKSENYS